MTIPPQSGVTDMQPARLLIATSDDGLINKLIEISEGDDELRILMCDLWITNEYVGSLAMKMLRILRTPHPLIELRATVTTGNYDPAKTEAEWFQHRAAQ